MYIEMDLVTVKLFSEKGPAEIPLYKTDHSAGCDVVSIDDDFELKPFETRMVHTGLYMEIPVGYEVQVRPRSGLALSHSITVLNSPGTVDADFRGECNVILYNGHPTESFFVKKGERIAQFVLAPVSRIVWATCLSKDELTQTKRGDGGFGSTGSK